METVHLIGGHHVEHLLHGFLAEEMTAFVEHETTPAEARGVFNLDNGQGHARSLFHTHASHHGTCWQHLL